MAPMTDCLSEAVIGLLRDCFCEEITPRVDVVVVLKVEANIPAKILCY